MPKDFAENLDAALQLVRNLEAVGVSHIDKVVALVAPSVPGPRAAVGAGSWNGGNRGQAGHCGGGFHGPQGSRPSGGLSQGASSGFQGSGARPKDDMICWYCDHKGHSKAECRKKAAANAAAKNGPSKNGREPGSYRPLKSQ
jgi:hypothetical protein